jgi:hypothetical protein
MINKNPYLIGQRTLDLLNQIEVDGLLAQDVLESSEKLSAEEYGRYSYMFGLSCALYEAIDADELAAQIDPQLG